MLEEFVCVCLCVYVCVCVYMCVCMSGVFVCVYLYTWRVFFFTFLHVMG